MTATIEVKQGVNCHYLELRGQAICDMIDALPVGLCRMIPEKKIEELWKNFLLHLPDDRDRTIEFTVNTVRELFTAAGLGKEPKTMDEVVVCLTKQEIRDLLDGYTANAKLRKAWEAMK